MISFFKIQHNLIISLSFLFNIILLFHLIFKKCTIKHMRSGARIAHFNKTVKNKNFIAELSYTGYMFIFHNIFIIFKLITGVFFEFPINDKF